MEIFLHNIWRILKTIIKQSEAIEIHIFFCITITNFYRTVFNSLGLLSNILNLFKRLKHFCIQRVKDY